ncbi:MAG: antibiotic biosynthesis monooxygenase [Acidimicrobiia bacterium]|nr:antibiotic biosynthesis monooxygenase [Acidimicrobiia bacterium]
MAIVIFTRLTAVSGRRDDLLAMLEELGVATRAEPGCQEFVVYAARDEADCVLGYEMFVDDDAVVDHRATEAVKVAQERLPALLTGPPEITYAIG